MTLTLDGATLSLRNLSPRTHQHTTGLGRALTQTWAQKKNPDYIGAHQDPHNCALEDPAQENRCTMDQYLIATSEGSQLPPQHQGSQAQSMAQLLPCAVHKEDPHSSAFTRKELQDHEEGAGVHD